MKQANTTQFTALPSRICHLQIAAATTLLLIGSSLAVAAPAGYERWTRPESSYVGFEEPCRTLSKQYSFPEFFGRLSKDWDSIEPNLFRLIDIEIRSGLHEDNDYVFDAVKVQNTGSFQTASWLLCDISTAYLKGLTMGKHAFVLDAERYSAFGEERWAAILQVTYTPTRWQFIAGYTIDEINVFLEIGNYRVIDIDHYGFRDGESTCDQVPDGQACGPVLVPEFSAVVVKNEGGNQIDSVLLSVTGDESSVPSQVQPGMQLVDREIINWAQATVQPFYWDDPAQYKSAMVFVDSGNGYKTHEQLDQNKVQLNHISLPVVDIEWSRTAREGFAGDIYQWHTVNVDLP